MQFANVIIDRKVKELDRCLQYSIPPKLETEIMPGQVVMVPLGRADTPTQAYVVEVTDQPEFDVQKTKSILYVVKERLTVEKEMLILAYWMHQRYGVTMSKALQTVTPIKTKVARPERVFYTIACPQEVLQQEIYEIRRKKGRRAQLRFLEALLQEKLLEHEIAAEKLKITSATVRPLIEKGIVKKEKIAAQNQSVIKELVQEEYCIRLNEQQQQAVADIWEEYEETGQKRPCLLYGITGSGKTEVYIELIQKTVAQNRQAILLIPEIALTYQMVMRFYRRFGDRVAVMNSRMSQGERYDQYQRMLNREVDVVIGPRSALFAPFENLGIVIVDEEHEDSYKSENNPKYHAREVAMYRARLKGARVVFGSATPSVETNYLAENGVYRKVALRSRGVSTSQLAAVHVVDMRQEMQEGNTSILSRTLRQMIQERLEREEQVMLFLNRRGYSNYLACYSCGEVIKCPRCDIALTYHQDNFLRCHYCGYSAAAPSQGCPHCNRKGRLHPMGIGTQKAMLLVQQAFPSARILRMDQDTTGTKNAHQQILTAFANHEADILLGTQMIVKGHDYENVTLMGILLADRSLNMPSYRAAEKTFQLLTQAAGRAGRGSKAGDVVIQTYRPEHFAIQTAAAQDYERFYDAEIKYRRLLQYPPAISIMMILFQSASEDAAIAAAEATVRIIRAENQSGRSDGAVRSGSLAVYGPSEDSIPKINYIYRKTVTVKCNELSELVRLQERITEEQKHFTNAQKDVIIEFDIIQ